MKTGAARGVSIHAAILLLILVAIGATILLALWLYPHASSAASTPRLPRVEVEAVEAYVVPGLGTYIGIYERNIGSYSASIRRLESLGIAVYVYDWKGDLVAVNTSARVVREGVPDGVWEPNELIVVEAFVPVELRGYQLEGALGPVPTGYIVKEAFGGHVAAVARLTVRNIHVVNATVEANVCALILYPGSRINLDVVQSPSFNPNLVAPGASLASLHVVMAPLNETAEALVEASETDLMGAGENYYVDSYNVTTSFAYENGRVSYHTSYLTTGMLLHFTSLTSGIAYRGGVNGSIEGATSAYGPIEYSVVVRAEDVALGQNYYNVTAVLSASVNGVSLTLGTSRFYTPTSSPSLAGPSGKWIVAAENGYIAIVEIDAYAGGESYSWRPDCSSHTLPTWISIAGGYTFANVTIGSFTPPWRS